MHAGTSTRFQVGNGTFIDRRLLSMSGRRPRPLAGGHERRLGGNRQRDGAAVEHDDDGRHAGPEVRVLLHAEQPDVDAPQDLLRPPPRGRAAVEQLPHAPAAPVPPDLRTPGAWQELTLRGLHLQNGQALRAAWMDLRFISALT